MNQKPVELVVVEDVAHNCDRSIPTETTEPEDRTYNAVVDYESDGDALSREADGIYTTETESVVTYRRASVETYNDESWDEHPVNISFSDSVRWSNRPCRF